MGSPIAHSRSPQIHLAAYEVLGLPWSYEQIECTENEFEAKLLNFDSDWHGLSLTMPLKEIAFRAAATRDDWAVKSGVVNTLVRQSQGDEQKWSGFNTDVLGLARALAEDDIDVSKTVIFGAGATAESAILATKVRAEAKNYEPNITVLARRAEAAKALAAKYDCAWGVLNNQEQSQLFYPTAIISTLPSTAADSVDVTPNFLSAHLFDVAYDPHPSPLSQKWQAAGERFSNGISMLINQALLQIRIFVNGTPNQQLSDESRVLAAMRRAGMKQ